MRKYICAKLLRRGVRSLMGTTTVDVVAMEVGPSLENRGSCPALTTTDITTRPSSSMTA